MGARFRRTAHAGGLRALKRRLPATLAVTVCLAAVGLATLLSIPEHVLPDVAAIRPPTRLGAPGVAADSYPELPPALDRLRAQPVHVLPAHTHRVGATSPPLAELAHEMGAASDPHLPPIVATVNGQPIRAFVVAQAEGLVRAGPHPPSSRQGVEQAALDAVITDIVVDDAGQARGLAPSPSAAVQALRALHGGRPTAQQIASYRLALAGQRLLRAVAGQRAPARAQAAVRAFVASLLAKASIAVARGFRAP